jgi:hypothetical protein
MIRPFTCICFLLACGSGLYLYQSKHRVQMIDREIEKTVHGTDALREQTRVLHAEWTLLNDPQRLQALAEQFLSLKTVTPGQFTSMAELDARLPAVRAPDPLAPPEQPPVPVAQAPETMPPEEPAPPPVAAATSATPTAPKPANVAVVTPPPTPRSPEHKPLPPVHVAAEAAPARPALVAAHPVIAAYASRPVSPRVTPVSLPAQQTSGTPVGSSLGMARSATVPPPQPMPVSTWTSGASGG